MSLAEQGSGFGESKIIRDMTRDLERGITVISEYDRLSECKKRWGVVEESGLVRFQQIQKNGISTFTVSDSSETKRISWTEVFGQSNEIFETNALSAGSGIGIIEIGVIYHQDKLTQFTFTIFPEHRIDPSDIIYGSYSQRRDFFLKRSLRENLPILFDYYRLRGPTILVPDLPFENPPNSVIDMDKESLSSSYAGKKGLSDDSIVKIVRSIRVLFVKKLAEYGCGQYGEEQERFMRLVCAQVLVTIAEERSATFDANGILEGISYTVASLLLNYTERVNRQAQYSAVFRKTGNSDLAVEFDTEPKPRTRRASIGLGEYLRFGEHRFIVRPQFDERLSAQIEHVFPNKGKLEFVFGPESASVEKVKEWVTSDDPQAWAKALGINKIEMYQV